MVLYILGNGFDIEHGISSRYSDFKKFLFDKEGFARNCYKKNRKAYYKLKNTDSDVVRRDSILHDCISRYLYDNEFTMNWSDLEKKTEVLADLYYNHPEYISDPERDGDRIVNGRYVNISSKHANELITDFNWIDDFQLAFSEWVEFINLAKTHQQLQIDSTNSLVLSFNYNTMVQDTYGIPELMIQYVHRMSIGDGYFYVFGHNKEPVVPDISDSPEKELELSTVSRMQMAVYKDCESRLSLVDELIEGKKIDRVAVFGCSFNDIDYPYFERVREYVDDSCQWYLYYHNNSDQKKAEKYRNDLQIENCRILHTSEFPRC